MKLFHKYSVPKHSIIALVVVFTCNMLTFYCTRLFFTPETEFHNMACAIDSLIPFVPAMIVFYIGWFPYILVNFYIITRRSVYDAVHFTCADLLGYIVTASLFIIYPATMTRPEIHYSDVFSLLVKLIYLLDSPTNLFPSIHCYATTLAILGTVPQKELHWKYKIFVVLFGIGICLSTLMVKQHVFADALAGILLAIICWFITMPFTKQYTHSERIHS